MHKQNMQVIHFPCSNFCLQDATLWSKTQLDPFSFNIHLLYEHWSYVEQEGLLSTCSDLVGKAWNLFGWQVQPHGCKNCLERAQDAFNVHPGLGTQKMSPWFHLKKKYFLKDFSINLGWKMRRSNQWENIGDERISGIPSGIFSHSGRVPQAVSDTAVRLLMHDH